MNIDIKQNTTFGRTWQLQNADQSAYDLTGCLLVFEIRANYGASTYIYRTTTGIGGNISVPTPSNGQAFLVMPDSITEAFPNSPQKWVYDLHITLADTTTVLHLEGGSVNYTPSAVR